MLNYVYVVYDVVSQSVLRIFLFRNDELALRSLKQFISIPNNVFSQFLEDLTLFRVGRISDDNIVIIPEPSGKFEIVEFKNIVKDFLNHKKNDEVVNNERIKNEEKK